MDAPGATGRSCHIFAGSLSCSMNPLIAIALLRTSAICWSETGWWLVLWMTRVSGFVRYPGKSLSNCSCAWRTALSGGRYFSLMPPNDSLPTGRISASMIRMMGTANSTGRFITRLTSLPQKPFSISSRVFVRCRRSASQFRNAAETLQFRRNGTRNRVRTPSASTCLPSTPRHAGNKVIDRMADSITDAIVA